MKLTWKFLLALLGCAITQLGFSGYSIVLKAGAQDSAKVNPLIFSLLRDVCCFPILLIAATVSGGWRAPRKQDVLLFFALGFTGIFGNQFFFILGLYYTSPVNASVLQPSIPVLTLIIQLVLGMERLQWEKWQSWSKLTGILLAVSGSLVMIMVGKDGSFAGSGSSGKKVLGNGFLFLNCLFMAVYVIIQKKYFFSRKLDKIYSPLHITAWSYGCGATFMAVTSIYYVFEDRSAFDVSVKVLYPLLYAVVVSSAICYALISWCNQVLGSTLVTAFWPVQTLGTMAMSAIFLGSKVELKDGIGGALICTGLLAVCLAKWKEGNAESERGIRKRDSDADNRSDGDKVKEDSADERRRLVGNNSGVLNA